MHSRLISRLGLIGYSYALMFRGEFFRDGDYEEKSVNMIFYDKNGR